jgi:hypothetical protein
MGEDRAAIEGKFLAVSPAADEHKDRTEPHDPVVDSAIAESCRQYAGGKGRPIEEFFAELEGDSAPLARAGLLLPQPGLSRLHARCRPVVS